MSATLTALGCLVAARAALAPLRRMLRAPDGLLAADPGRRGRALNALAEIEHQLQRLVVVIDPGSTPGALANDADAPTSATIAQHGLRNAGQRPAASDRSSHGAKVGPATGVRTVTP
jgi:hypothetical protein